MRTLRFLVTLWIGFVLTNPTIFATQSVKTVNDLAIASVKTVADLAIANVKTVKDLDNTSGSVSVTYVSDADKTDVASGNDTFTSFAVSGSNPAIIVIASVYTSTISGISASAGLTIGTAYRVKSITIHTTSTLEIWAVPAPSGTGTLTVSYSASVAHQCCAVLLNNCHQTTPGVVADSITTACDGSANITGTPTNLTANDMVIYGLSNATTGDAPNTTSGTDIFFGNSTNVNAAFAYRAGTGAVNGTWGAAPTTGDAGLVAARIVPP